MNTVNARKHDEFGWEVPLEDDVVIGFVRFTKDRWKLGVSKLFKEGISDKWTWVRRLGKLLEEELRQDRDEFKQIESFTIVEKERNPTTADPTFLFGSSLSVLCRVEELKPNKAGRLV